MLDLLTETAGEGLEGEGGGDGQVETGQEGKAGAELQLKGGGGGDGQDETGQEGKADAELQRAKGAYKTLARVLHPEEGGRGVEGAGEAFVALRDAWLGLQRFSTLPRYVGARMCVCVYVCACVCACACNIHLVLLC